MGRLMELSKGDWHDLFTIPHGHWKIHAARPAGIGFNMGSASFLRGSEVASGSGTTRLDGAFWLQFITQHDDVWRGFNA